MGIFLSSFLNKVRVRLVSLLFFRSIVSCFADRQKRIYATGFPKGNQNRVCGSRRGGQDDGSLQAEARRNNHNNSDDWLQRRNAAIQELEFDGVGRRRSR